LLDGNVRFEINMAPLPFAVAGIGAILVEHGYAAPPGQWQHDYEAGVQMLVGGATERGLLCHAGNYAPHGVERDGAMAFKDMDVFAAAAGAYARCNGPRPEFLALLRDTWFPEPRSLLDPRKRTRDEQVAVPAPVPEKKQAKVDLQHLLFVLDRSGSMSTLRGTILKEFNRLIADQKRDNPDALFTAVTFNHERKELFDKTPMREVTELTGDQYDPAGQTALYDTLGYLMLTKFRNVRNVKMFVLTDGLDNESTKFSQDDIKKHVETAEAKFGWTVRYFGANQDATAVGTSLGAKASHTKSFAFSMPGMTAAFGAISGHMSGRH